MEKDIRHLLDGVKKLHFVGIGGSGMFPLVQILHSEGFIISGSDVDDNSDNVKSERAMGIKVNVPHMAEAVEGADALVVSAAIFPDNPEIVRANQLSIPIIKRSQLLGYVTSLYDKAFCISGTHGKTSATSMLTQILFDAGKDPSAVIGGRLPAINGYGRRGSSDIMTCESCEFVDTFLELLPDYSVILNIDRDHLEYFGTEERLAQSFTRFANNAEKAIIANADDTKTVKALADAQKPVIWFGKSEGCQYRITDVELLPRACFGFTLELPDNTRANIKLSAPGEHHVYNAAAAAACAHIAGCTPEEIQKGLAAFKGAGRRFEIVGEVNGITVADDYAHHPREIACTLETAVKMGYSRVWAVFQPFTYSRTKMLLEDFAKSLSIADRVVMTKIMGGREREDKTVSTAQLAKLIDGSVWFNEFDEVADYILNNAAEGDLVITMGCGDIYKAARMIVHNNR